MILLIRKKNCGFFVSLLFLSMLNHCFIFITNIIIPFDFPFAILGNIFFRFITFLKHFSPIEHRHNSDPNKKIVYAVADGQYTYGPLSLFQYHNDEKYANMYFFHCFKTKIIRFYLEFEGKNYQHHYHAR